MDLRIAGEDEVLLELAAGAGPRGVLRRRAAALARGPCGPAAHPRADDDQFSRFMLGDLFIHGIGGAKYDELGDEIARRFFGIEPPGFLDCLDDALARLAD